MGTLIKEAVKDAVKALGVRGILIAVAVLLIGYAGYTANSVYKGMKSQISTQAANLVTEQNNVKQANKEANSQKVRADQAQQNADLLTKQLAVQQAASQAYHQQLATLELNKEKQDEETDKTIKSMQLALKKAGVSNVRVPASIIRMQQHAICTANGDCKDSNANAG